MLHIHKSLLALFLLALTSCQSTNTDSTAKFQDLTPPTQNAPTQDTQTSIFDVSCDQGDPVWLRMIPNGFVADNSLAAFPSVPNPPNFTFRGVYQNIEIRLFACAVETATSFNVSVKHLFRKGGIWMRYNVEDAFPQQGVAELLGGDHTNLFVRAALENETERKVILRGFTQTVEGEQKTFAAGLRVTDETGTLETISRRAITGKFVIFDGQTDEICPRGSTFRGWQKIVLDTATIELDMCNFQAAGQTTGFDFVGIKVTDTHADLQQHAGVTYEVSGTPIEVDPTTKTWKLENADITAHYNWHHHNGCDSLHIALAHANYAFATAPTGGCGPAVDEAPANASGPIGQMKYRYRYFDQPWQEGHTDQCGHFRACQ